MIENGATQSKPKDCPYTFGWQWNLGFRTRNRRKAKRCDSLVIFSENLLLHSQSAKDRQVDRIYEIAAELFPRKTLLID